MTYVEKLARKLFQLRRPYTSIENCWQIARDVSNIISEDAEKGGPKLVARKPTREMLIAWKNAPDNAEWPDNAGSGECDWRIMFAAAPAIPEDANG